jgi:hypothetical protein
VAADEPPRKYVSLSGLATLHVPADMRAAEGLGVDSAVSAWENDELSISVDTGPFVDRLERGPRGADVTEQPSSGRVVRTTSFTEADGSAVAVAHVPEVGGEGPLPRSPAMTIVVRAKPGTAAELPVDVIRSLSFGGDAPPKA